MDCPYYDGNTMEDKAAVAGAIGPQCNQCPRICPHNAALDDSAEDIS